MTRALTTGTLLGVALLLAVPAVAEEPRGAEEPVPLYTNEDLEKYEVYAGGPDPEPSPEADWDFVVEFLERQYERIDADRRHDLAQSRLDRLHERPVLAPRPLHRFGFHPFFPLSSGPGWKHDRARGPRRPHDIRGRGHRGLPDLKGEDAVPGPRPHRPHNGSELPPPR